jgi:hypothetical protein
MSKETIDKMFENVNKLRKKIKEIKKIEDYGITSVHISESMIYPDLTDMKQDIWLSKEDKIRIEYLDEDNSFEINLIFKDRSIIKALRVVIIYLSHWNNDLYVHNLKIWLEDREIQILSHEQVSYILKKEGLRLEENHQGETYSIVDEGVWMNIEGTIRIIESLKKTERISIKINKIAGEENFWHYMSCIRISFESKYYEDGYLNSLEWRRLDPYLAKNYERQIKEIREKNKGK